MFLNRMTLIGFTGREPKMFATPADKEITRLSVATTRRYQQDSEWKEKTQWHDCVLYGSAAQYAANLPKGSHVFVEGELSYREYTRTIESESGAVSVQWPVAEIVVESIKVLDQQEEGEPRERGSRLAAPSRPCGQIADRKRIFPLQLLFDFLTYEALIH